MFYLFVYGGLIILWQPLCLFLCSLCWCYLDQSYMFSSECISIHHCILCLVVFNQVSWKQGWCWKTTEMFCGFVEFGWCKGLAGGNGKTWIVCPETPKRRRRWVNNLTHPVLFSPFIFPTMLMDHPPSGNNIYGDNVRETLIKLQREGSDGLAAYILMQRIFPTDSSAFLVRDGICHQDLAISELGIYGAYLR